MTHKDPKQYCIACGTSYGFMEENCGNCGFDPMNDPDQMKAQDKAESDFSAWQNSGRDE